MIISLFRDGLSGTRYVIYVIICLTLLFSIVGYLLKEKYGKVEFKVASSGATTSTSSKPKKEKKVKTKKEKKSKGSALPTKTVAPAAPIPSVQPQPIPKTPAQAPQVVQTPKPVQQVSTPVQVQPAATNVQTPAATKVAPIPEPTLVAKTTTSQQPQVTPTTLNQPTSLPDLGAPKTGNPVIDDDITTII